mgnify:CR=1 FL=1
MGCSANAVCPGWTNTGHGSRRPSGQRRRRDRVGRATSDDGPTGGFFRDGLRLLVIRSGSAVIVERSGEPDDGADAGHSRNNGNGERAGLSSESATAPTGGDAGDNGAEDGSGHERAPPLGRRAWQLQHTGSRLPRQEARESRGVPVGEAAASPLTIVTPEMADAGQQCGRLQELMTPASR